MFVRATGICVYDSKLLIVEQNIADRAWSLPGGKVEEGETLHDAVVREIKEETGIDVAINRMLYITQRINDNKHVINVGFAVDYVAGIAGENTNLNTNEKIGAAKFVPLSDLKLYGFTEAFVTYIMRDIKEPKYFESIVDLGL